MRGLRALHALGGGQASSRRIQTTSMSAGPSPSPPGQPTLEGVSGDSMRVRFTAPQAVGGAAPAKFIIIEVSDGALFNSWQKLDGLTQKIATGFADAMPFAASDTECVVTGLDPAKTYVARARAGSANGWSSNSTPSDPLRLSSLRPAAPCAPALEAVSYGRMAVHFTLPPRLPGSLEPSEVVMQMREVGGTWKFADAASCKLVDGPGKAFDATQGKCEVIYVVPSKAYEARVAATNAFGCGEFSSPSAPLKIADLRPSRPAAPLLKAVSESSLTVYWAIPPQHPSKTPLRTRVRAFRNL